LGEELLSRLFGVTSGERLGKRGLSFQGSPVTFRGPKERVMDAQVGGHRPHPNTFGFWLESPRSRKEELTKGKTD